jgi:O-antigen ligase
MTQSAAGAGLALVALAGAFVLHLPELRVNWRVAALVFIAAMVAVAGLYFSGIFADNLTDAATGANLNRLAFFRTGWRMVAATFPFGSGLGTFADYYHWFEDIHAVSPTFVNHAHDDMLELVIETGVLGVAALVLFALWWLERARTILAHRRSSPYPLAALLALGVVFAHSAVDYPLRTAAVASLFALCAVIVQRNPAREARRVPTLERGPMVIRRI